MEKVRGVLPTVNKDEINKISLQPCKWIVIKTFCNFVDGFEIIVKFCGF
jgi:hypothetical protein